MARNRSRVTFEHRQIDVRVREVTPMIERRVEALIGIAAAEATAYAKIAARWMDQTGAARTGLFAVANKRGLGKYEVVLAHAVSYGIWLEVKNNGRYAIIEQTLRQVGSNTMGRMRGLLG